MEKYTDANGKSAYRGYCIDMFEEISKLAKFEYKLYETPGNSYGRLNEKGQWDGAVRELIDKVCICWQINRFQVWHRLN